MPVWECNIWNWHHKKTIVNRRELSQTGIIHIILLEYVFIGKIMKLTSLTTPSISTPILSSNCIFLSSGSISWKKKHQCSFATSRATSRAKKLSQSEIHEKTAIDKVIFIYKDPFQCAFERYLAVNFIFISSPSTSAFLWFSLYKIHLIFNKTMSDMSWNKRLFLKEWSTCNTNGDSKNPPPTSSP